MDLDQRDAETNEKFIERLATAKEKATDFERLQRAEAGLESGDGNSHDTQREAAARTEGAGKRTSRGAKSGSDAWLDLLNEQLIALQGGIDDAEAGFASQYGEDWREQMAQDILDPDLIPQRRDGESMTDYRARVEEALMDELLNPDGSIKDKYRDHPEYGAWAQWAQWKHDQQDAQALNDPSLSKAQRSARIEAFTQSATHERLEQVLLAETNNNTDRATLDAAKEALEDQRSAAAVVVTEGGFDP